MSGAFHEKHIGTALLWKQLSQRPQAPPNGRYQRSKEDWCDKYELLLSRLSPEEQKLLDAADWARIHCDMLEEADVFAQAFRLGARVMLEVLR